MYVIRTCSNPDRLEVEINGVLEAPEMVRCISQASALAEAANVTRVCADLSGAERCGLDHGLIVAALRSRSSMDLKLAVITSERVARIAERILTRAGLPKEQAQSFSERADADAWLGLSSPQRELAETARRHLDHAASLLGTSEAKHTKETPRTSVA